LLSSCSGSGCRFGHYGIRERLLVAYVDTIDERLLDYVDEDDELGLVAVRKNSYVGM
jgi:hypothetical protein